MKYTTSMNDLIQNSYSSFSFTYESFEYFRQNIQAGDAQAAVNQNLQQANQGNANVLKQEVNPQNDALQQGDQQQMQNQGQIQANLDKENEVPIVGEQGQVSIVKCHTICVD